MITPGSESNAVVSLIEVIKLLIDQERESMDTINQLNETIEQLHMTVAILRAEIDAMQDADNLRQKM